MSQIISFSVCLTTDGTIDHSVRNFSFFDQASGQHHPVPTIEKVKNAQLYVPSPCSQFVNAVSKVITLWSSECMTLYSKAPDFREAFGVPSPIRLPQCYQPFKNRHLSRLLAVEDNLGPGHAWSVQYIALLL